MMIQFSSSTAFPIFSAGFVVARLFPLLKVSSPPWSVAAFTPQSWNSIGSFARKRSSFSGKTIRGDCRSNQRWMNSLFSSSPSPSSSSLFSLDSSSVGTCCDESVLQLLDEATVHSIDCLVQERSTARFQGNYTMADDLKNQIIGFSRIPFGYEIVLKDIPRSSGGGSRWNLIPTKEIHCKELLSGPTILQLAHAAMGLAVENNQQTQNLERQRFRQESLEAIVDKAKSRLEILIDETKKMDEINSVFEVSTKNTVVQGELGGRTASDAALWFAFAGITDEDLFHWLADIASWELQRFGQRPSFRSKYTLQIVERFAAAGLKHHAKLERTVHDCLARNEEEPRTENGMPMENVGSNVHLDDDAPQTGKPIYLYLHSDRSLLLIWKFATKQKKQRSFLRSARKNWEQFSEGEFDNETHSEIMPNFSDDVVKRKDSKMGIAAPSYDWKELFKDTSRPLVVDVGCGMGVSLLGLASSNDLLQCSKESSRLLLNDTLAWSDCNFVGVDLGALGIEYARGIAHRWKLEENLHFCIDAAEDFCQHLNSYPGEVRCCMIQFPTPFRLQNKDTGNSQLPASQLDGFMVSENLLEIIRSSLHPTEGKLLLQSNCEDVAVWMRKLACKKDGFKAIDEGYDDTPSGSSASIPERIPQRTLDWIAMDGERAEGQGWFQKKILHRNGATETEVSCEINGTPIHRCVLRVGDGFRSI